MICDFCRTFGMNELEYVEHVYREHDKHFTKYQIIQKLGEIKRELELCRNGVISKK